MTSSAHLKSNILGVHQTGESRLAINWAHDDRKEEEVWDYYQGEDGIFSYSPIALLASEIRLNPLAWKKEDWSDIHLYTIK